MVFVVCFFSGMLASMLTVELLSLATACISGFVTESFIIISYSVAPTDVGCTLSTVNSSKLALLDMMFIVNT